MKKLYILDLEDKIKIFNESNVLETNNYNIISTYEENSFRLMLNKSRPEDDFLIISRDPNIKNFYKILISTKQREYATVIHSSCKSYFRSEIQNSFLQKETIVGDFSRVEESYLGQYCKIERNNLIRNSFIDDYSFTGVNNRLFDACLGKFVQLGWNVTVGPHAHEYKCISTHSFVFKSLNRRFGLLDNPIVDGKNTVASTKIGNDVWLGCNSIIMRGVKVGDGAIVGSGSVVTKDVPPYAIVVGNPAHILKYRFNNQIIEKLLQIKWWNWDRKKIRQNENLFLKKELEIEDLDKLV